MPRNRHKRRAGQSAPSAADLRRYENALRCTLVLGLAGRRLVVASETGEGGRLRIQLVKQLTGDETLKGRYMRQDYFSFPRTFKTLLVTNNKPRISEAKTAIWRRIRMIPFTVCIPLEKQDRKLTAKLRDEWPGILCFFVEGAVAFHRSGSLATPEIVVQATNQYRTEQDVVQAFIDERCVLGAEVSISRTAIWNTYAEWAGKTGERSPLDREGLYERLRLHGAVDCFVAAHGTRLRGFRGIGLAHQGDPGFPVIS